MAEPFRLSAKGEDGHTYLSVRLPNALLEKICAAAETAGYTRNQFVVDALDFAITHLDLRPIK